MNAAFWAAVGGGGTLLAVLLVLLGHMFAFARGQGARDEREKQTATRLGQLESRADAHATTAAAQATQLALHAQAVGAFEKQLELGLSGVVRQIQNLAEMIASRRGARPKPADDER